MEIKFSCRGCNSFVKVDSSRLCSYWEEQRAKIAKDRDFFLTVQVGCDNCGVKTVHNTPIFRYIFKIMFRDYLAETNI